MKAANPGALMLDSGDAIWSGNIYWRPGGEPVLELMNAVPYDALCMGNREFHFLGAGATSKTSRAQFPILSANLRAAKGRRKTAALPYVIFEREGVRVAVVGLSVPCITERMLVKKISGSLLLNSRRRLPRRLCRDSKWSPTWSLLSLILESSRTVNSRRR